jgi:hypothetical protein
VTKPAVLAIGVLLAAVVGSEVYVVRQNWQLRQRLAASVTAAAAASSAKSERTKYESGLIGRCQPFQSSTRGTAAAARLLEVSIYFSLDRDCLSCVKELLEQWNGALRAGLPLTVTGYTTVDGTQDEHILTEMLKPEFPVVRVDQIEGKLRELGVTATPVVFVTDATTGRILFTHAPLASEKRDRSFVDRVRTLAAPCETAALTR